MIALWAFNAIIFLCNWALVSSSILTAKDDSNLRIFKELPSKFDLTKRHINDDSSEEESSTEKRISGTNFIRYGRGRSELNVNDNSAALETTPKVNRHPRWKSPDIVIRFGRSKLKTANNEQLKRGKADLNFIRYGRNIQIPADINLSTLCRTVISSNMVSDAELHPDVARLYLHLCNSLNKFTGEINSDDFFENQVY